MAENIPMPNVKRKMIKLPAQSIPEAVDSEKITLPYNGNAVTEKGLYFSFACFDRNHKLFNLGENGNQDSVVSGKWFLDLFECLKSVNNMTFSELKASKHQLHPIDWNKCNAKPPECFEQLNYWQFRIDKSKGRVHGFILNHTPNDIFFVMWLDPHHNLSDSEGYGTATYHYRPKSTYETMQEKMEALQDENNRLKGDLKAAEELMAESKNQE